MDEQHFGNNASGQVLNFLRDVNDIESPDEVIGSPALRLGDNHLPVNLHLNHHNRVGQEEQSPGEGSTKNVKKRNQKAA